MRGGPRSSTWQHDPVGGPAFTGKVGNVSWPGPDQKNGNLPNVDMGKTRGRFKLLFDDTGQIAKQRKYRIHLDDGRVVEGSSDDQGLTSLVEDDTLRILRIEIGAPEVMS